MKQKHKTKDKVEEQTELSTKVELQTENQTQYKFAGRDSTAFQSDLKAESSFLSSLQNLKLTNNGKCLDGGEIRFVRFTDAQGNKTEVPVNDNTELNYSSDSEILKEKTILKAEISKLKSENSDLKKEIKSSVAQNQEKSENNKTTDVKIETAKKQNSLMSYVWTAVLSILLFQIALFFIKKQFLKP